MRAGIIVRRNGAVVLDSSQRIPRTLGLQHVNGTDGELVHYGLWTGEPFFSFQRVRSMTYARLGYVSVPRITVEGARLIWRYPSVGNQFTERMPGQIVFGVY